MARDNYGSFGSVPESTGSSGPAQPLQNINTNGNMFGAQVGQAMEASANQSKKSAEELTEYVIKEEAKATEAKVNDDYANKYVPAAIELRNTYDSLEGQDKVHGYKQYIDGLKELNGQYTSTRTNGYESQLWGDLTNRRLVNEQESANRELAAAQKELSIKASADRYVAEMGIAASNYNDPAIVDQSWGAIEGTIEMQAIDNGLDPSRPEDAEKIDMALQSARGEFAATLLDSAVARGDVQAANSIYALNEKFIPGYQQAKIETVLSTENLRQTGTHGADAIISGNIMPPPIGQAPITVQAQVADAWHDAGLDPNEGLALAQVESAMGTITGVRGTIGQDKESKGQPMDVQIASMRKYWMEAKGKATATLGRTPEGWETYAVYQQGVAGGPALLNAAMNSPAAKAVDVIAPLYKSRETAKKAITGNGGNLTMTSADFLDVIQGKYERAAGVTRTRVSGSRPGEAMIRAYSEAGETVQPAATPLQALSAFEKKQGGMLARVESIPNDSVKAAVKGKLAAQEGILRANAEAYKAEVMSQTQALQYSPDFKSMDQAPATLQATLKAEFPKEFMDLKLAADKNRGADPNPVAIGELESRVNNLFDVRTKKDGKITVRMREGGLEDSVRLQDEIMAASDQGIIDATSAKSMIKTIQVNMGGLAGGDKIKIDGSSNFEDAYKEFVNSGANPTEVNRMFRDYVQASDQYKFDDVTKKDQPFYESMFESLFGGKKPSDPKQMTPERAVQSIMAAQAKKRYEGLVMLPTTPNAVIGRDGSSMTMTSQPPTGKADTTLNIRAERRRDASGNEAIVYYNKDGSLLKIEAM